MGSALFVHSKQVYSYNDRSTEIFLSSMVNCVRTIVLLYIEMMMIVVVVSASSQGTSATVSFGYITTLATVSGYSALLYNQ